MNTIHERAYDERTTHPTVQISTPARRVLSIREPYTIGVMSPSILRRLSHHAIIKLGQSTREMIVMVVQPQPVGGKVARRHYVPDGADVLPADVSPLYRGYHLQLTCSLLNGDGPQTDGTWAKDGKRRRERPK